MKRQLTERVIIAALILLAVVFMVVYFENQPRIAPGQKQIIDIRNIESLRAQFNNDAGKTRLIVLVSPT